jgi:hypothetical protein
LRRYKGQHVAGRRYGEFKGPLAVAPLFLETNRRITALITVICLALLIFCLAERQVRDALALHGEMMTGLPGYGPAPARPTGRTIFQALADLRLIPAHNGNPATVPGARPARSSVHVTMIIDSWQLVRAAGTARDQAGFITGTTLLADGGMTAGYLPRERDSRDH